MWSTVQPSKDACLKGKHISMTDDKHIVIIPHQHTINPSTLKQILEAAELSTEQFKDLL